MKYLSICSGIEAATVAWHGFGWEPVAFAEIEPFPAAVLKHHYPEVPNLGDMTKFKEWNLDAFDILVGGTPCQAFSVAGLRQSLDDARGNLSLVFCEMADHFDPQYILWENVPGVLSTKDNAFGCFLAGLAGEDVPLVAPGGKWTNAGFVLGPKRNVAWRVLDAQYFGLAQRRRRVFVVACPRDGADPREILFEREGVQRHSAPSREKGEGASRDAKGGSHWSGGAHPSLSQSSGGMSNQELFSQKRAGLVPVCMAHGQGNAEIVSDGSPSLNCNHEAPIAFAFDTTQVTSPANYSNPKPGDPRHPLASGAHAPAIALQSVDFGADATSGLSPTIRRHDPMAVCFGGDIARTLQARHDSSPCADRGMDVVALCARNGWGMPEEIVPPLKAQSREGDSAPCVAMALDAYNQAAATVTRTLRKGRSATGDEIPQTVDPIAMQVRRLTPVECERLQGFPDGYTAIPWRNKPASECPDGPRYKALGNSMAVPCMRWIGDRIRKTQDCAILG